MLNRTTDVWLAERLSDRSRKRRNSGGAEGSLRGGSLRPPCNRRQVGLSTQEDHRARFFEDYRKEAEDYDKEFMKKYDEDSNTTLIFVSFVLRRSATYAPTGSQAGLFSAVTSAFILDVQSQLQPDTGDETVALLRVLIYKIDNTTFGDDIPSIPQWAGPPRAIVQVQAILYASLAISLFSAFLAMLGKQWLNRYASTDLRGTAIERSQNRQRKLDAIAAWYFDHVMESLPLMLQIALLLLGCALSRYLWEINTTVASVVLGVTSFGVIFYLFIVVAGSASDSCPYQTPGARILLHIFHRLVLPAIHSFPSVIYQLLVFVVSKFSDFVQGSYLLYYVPKALRSRPWDTPTNVAISLVLLITWLTIAPAADAYRLGLTVFKPLAIFYRAVYCWFVGNSSPQTHELEERTIKLELRCIMWMLQASLDRTVHLSTLKHLELLVPMLADFDPTLVACCFNVFVGCVSVNNREVVIMQGSEQLATVTARCFFLTISHLSVMDPTSSVLKDLGQRYNKVFPADIEFCDHQFSPTMNAIHRVFIPRVGPQRSAWTEYKPPSDEHIMVARALVRLVKFKYGRMRQAKAPRWILRLTLYFLSLNPLPPTPVIADCLTIIAVDLDCDVSNPGAAMSDERYVHTL